MQSPNFLILDEPTNDLDIVTLGVLEEYLQAFKGCVIVVSHDRYFVDKVADHLLVFCGGGEIREFAGTYSDYTAWKRDYEAAKQAAVAQEKAKSAASGNRGGEIRKSGTAPAKTGAARKLTFQEKREMERLEAEIPELEQEKPRSKKNSRPATCRSKSLRRFRSGSRHSWTRSTPKACDGWN